MKKNRVFEKGTEIKFESNGRVKRVLCMTCGRKFYATFYRKDPKPDDVALCPYCEGLEFTWA